MATAKSIKATGKKNQASDCIVSTSLKRKSSNVEADKLLLNAKNKNVKSDTSLNSKILHVTRKPEMEYKEPIFYDEYLEGGIPDNLLEGLGFNSNVGPEPTEGEEDEDDLFEKGRHDVGSCETKIVAALPQSSTSVVLPLLGPTSNSRTDKRTKKSTTSRATAPMKSNDPIGPRRKSALCTNGSSQSGNQSNHKHLLSKQPVNQICESHSAIDLSNKSTSKSLSTTGLPHFTITKDNIEYEYKPTGEVVSRVVCDGAKGDRSRSRRKMTPIEPSPLPADSSDDCPINAANIEDVLDELYKETESTRIKLSSMRDDLRRVGAHNNIMKTKEQLVKAADVSRRVLKVYAAYKGVLEKLEKSTDKKMEEETKDSER